MFDNSSKTSTGSAQSAATPAAASHGTTKLASTDASGDAANEPNSAQTQPRDLRSAVMTMGQRWSSSQRELLPLVVELDRSGAWGLDGSRSCAHWVADALDIEISTAREWIRVGLALEKHALLAAAFADGRLSYSKVRTVTRVVNTDNEADLCELAERTPAGRLSTAIAAWLAPREDPKDTERRHHESRSFTCRTEPDGMIIGTFRLPPLAAAMLTAAIEALVMRQPVDGPSVGSGNAPAHAHRSASVTKRPTLAQQRADALVALAAVAIPGDVGAPGNAAGSGITTEIVIHVRGDGITLDDGTPVPGSIVERIAPESFIRALIHDAEGRPINGSGRRRHPTVRQRRVVQERDRRCVDCGTTHFLEFDHVPAFEVTGRTLVEELRIRCSGCHRARHSRMREAA